MKPELVADRLLEATVGPTQAQLDDIMGIIMDVVQELGEHAQTEQFEAVVNKRLANAGYPIRFNADDPLLLQYPVPGHVDEYGMVLRTPDIIEPEAFNMFRDVISHEGVHVFQIAAAERKGKAAEMFKSAHDRMMPGGKLDPRKYWTDPHEVMAHARTLIDRYRRQRLTRSQALQQLRRDPMLGSQHREQRQRFLKHAYQYAQDLPESNPVASAAKDAERHPTDAQKEAGNYSMGHLWLQGLNLSVENAKGSVRSGTSPSGKEWSVKMPSAYGYIRGTKGRDKDHIDVYIGPKPDSEVVYIIDQCKDDSTFDEHKCMVGFDSKEQAVETYDAAFSDDKGPQRRKAVTAVSMPDFKEWVFSDRTRQPYSSLDESTDPDDIDPQWYIDSVRSGRPKLDSFTRAYIEAALWSSNDNSDPETGGEPLDRNYDVSDIEDETLWQMWDDCQSFQKSNAELLAQAAYNRREYSNDEMAGHDFWLSRNGHGAGFFDRDLGEVGDQLQAAAESYGEVYLEVSDEGTIYAL